MAHWNGHLQFFSWDRLLLHFVDTHLLSVDGTHHHIQNPCIPSQQSCPLNCEYYVKGGTGCEFCMCDNSHQSTSPLLLFALAINWPNNNNLNQPFLYLKIVIFFKKSKLRWLEDLFKNTPVYFVQSWILRFD